MHTEISKWIKDYCINSNISSLVVGVSGGIDSAVVSTLCMMTGIPTHCVLMPIHQNPSHTERGLNHINWLKSKSDIISSHIFDLTDVYDCFVKTMSYSNSELGFANSRSRIRMTALYQIASTTNGIVVGTGNKIEDFGVGFFTKYGDGGVDISPIADLTKSEVYELANELGIIREIIDAPPTDGLWGDDRNDEIQIGATYPELEWAMEFKYDRDITKRESEVLSIYGRLNNQNKHKMVPIPIFKK